MTGRDKSDRSIPAATTRSELASVFASLRILILERLEPGSFRLLADPPAWFRKLAGSGHEEAPLRPGEMSAFLDNFLVDAEQFWKKGRRGLIHSGPWVEVSGDGRDYHLEARASSVGGRSLLLIEEQGESYRERRDLLQKARQNSLIHQRLVKEIQFKEVLLHCIVHDLAGPLMGIKGLFTLLAREELSEAGRRRLKIGDQASQKMEQLVQEILRVFSAEVETLESFSMDPADAPDLRACLGSVAETLQPAAQLKEILLEVDAPGEGDELKVAGESLRLERVLFNLLENALRHSPSGGRVRVQVRAGGDKVYVAVSDEGSGVEAERAPLLFQRFMQGKRRSGKAGLGLYFCRIMVERWGGRIGYEPRESGGSRFWFELPRAGRAEPGPAAVAD